MKYTETHEWIVVEGRIGTVGITHCAQKEIGEIVYVELPQSGKEVERGEEVVVVESTKAATDIHSPVSGTIVEMNTSLKEIPNLINSSAESEGWLYKIELTSFEQLDLLLNREQYHFLVEGADSY